MRVLVTGGAGFIGSAVIRHLLSQDGYHVINLDKLTYAANLAAIPGADDHPDYCFEKVDICEPQEIARVFQQHKPDAVMHLAAESHVDRSIDGPGAFIQTNIVGTQILLDAALDHWRSLPQDKQADFRFHHISTDEVYDSLGDTGLFTETTSYDPRSPYSASKASSDHLVMAWHETYGLPVVLSNCSNNYGPYQFPEKLIPLMILKALSGDPLPVYGKGDNIRDWLFVDDHAKGLQLVMETGKVGQSYNIGGRNERTNLEVVERICEILQELRPKENGSYKDQITFVADRPGHDFRYAIDATKIENDLGWQAEENFESGLRKTVEWYLANPDWGRSDNESYQGQRLGLGS